MYSFRVRFKSFIEQYELRELHFHSLMRTKELEVQYHMARFEREKKTAESESSKSRHLQAQVAAFTKTETELRNQLNVYVDKFKQVCCPSQYSGLPFGLRRSRSRTLLIIAMIYSYLFEKKWKTCPKRGSV